MVLETLMSIGFQGLLPNQILKLLQKFIKFPKKAAVNFHHCLPIHPFFPQKIANSSKLIDDNRLLFESLQHARC
jgi:hypothetical protein